MKRERLVPEFSTKPYVGCNAIVTIDNPFLQALVDKGCLIISEKNGFTLLAYETLVYFFIHHDCVTLECIGTHSDQRKRGSATMTMEMIAEIADSTQTRIELIATTVKVGELNHGVMAILVAGKAKGKIPVKKLPDWYRKFGFGVTHQDKSGVHMTREARNKQLT
jgi:hypothetical protein